MEELKGKLNKAGLTGNESKVYLELLKHEELTANKLSKKASMDRTLTYTVLNHLIEKGLVSYMIKKNKKFFKAESPENLLNPIKEKEFFTKDLISQLNKIQKTSKKDYEIKVYEGKEGLRNLMNLILKHKQFLSFGGTGRAYDQLYEMQAIVKNLKKREFSGKIIMQERYKNHEVTKPKVLEARYTNIKAEATTSIFGDYVSIHLAKEKPLIILIKNKDISDSYRNYFNSLWEQSKK
ncbi:MAG TPA: helix-turn-helix domain-containing protein [Candidatus Nanoarchaeia archaeon]|nr:helix-turn-helix domain-containing protein [Candidatus Nanoarchaeia archaeon]